MIKLKQLITERMEAHELGKIFSKAYVSIFDIDNVKVPRAIYTGAPAFVHTWAVIRVKFKYKMQEYLVVNRLVYYKFPPEEKDKLTSTEWEQMVVLADKMTEIPLTRNDILNKNQLIRYGAGIYKTDPLNSSDDVLNMDFIGEVYSANTMGDLVSNVKSIIDKNGSGESDNQDISPTPAPTEDEPVLSKT